MLSPLLTKFSSLDEIFAAFGSPASMWRTLLPSKPHPHSHVGLCVHLMIVGVFTGSEEPYSLMRCIAERFDDMVSWGECLG